MINMNINNFVINMQGPKMRNITAECEISPPVGTKEYDEWKKKQIPIKVEKEEKK